MPFDPAAYGRTWAASYDELFEERDDTAAIASFVAALAPGGRVLEMGVGTGRLAVPLAAAGLKVTGVDASPEMLSRLHARPGSEQIEVIRGDFTTVDAGGPYDVVLIAFSSLFLVPSQAGQLACLANARRHLGPGASLVIEAFVPDHSRWLRGQNIAIGRLDDAGVSLKLSVHHPVDQVISTQDVSVDAHGTTLRPNLLRYIWPSELDAMALASGLRPVRRHADWAGAPFTAQSTVHVSVFERPARSNGRRPSRSLPAAPKRRPHGPAASRPP
jgi:SAM-dependent methyltransferase